MMDMEDNTVSIIGIYERIGSAYPKSVLRM